jgi:hypothetical protein
MIMVLRVAAIVIGIFFFLPGFVGVFRPERLAEILALGPEGPVGLVTIRVLIGAPYIAMGLVTVFAAVRGRWAWLVPISAIEGVMALARILSGFREGFEAAGVGTILVEAVVCLVLALTAILPARAKR